MTSRLFQFHFAGTDDIQLIETRCISVPLDTPRVTVRGKTSGALRHAGSFQWTAGVRALCVLFVKGVLSKMDAEQPALLIGGHGSLAASLDFALSKQPTWLLDMFGTDSFGKCVALRLMNRTNTERKRPGPVTIGLKPNVTNDATVEVFLNNKLVTSAETLREMVARLVDTDEKGTVSDKVEAQPLAA